MRRKPRRQVFRLACIELVQTGPTATFAVSLYCRHYIITVGIVRHLPHHPWNHHHTADGRHASNQAAAILSTRSSEQAILCLVCASYFVQTQAQLASQRYTVGPASNCKHPKCRAGRHREQSASQLDTCARSACTSTCLFKIEHQRHRSR